MVSGARAEPASTWPAEVTATYTISFTGFGEIGRMRFQSQVQGGEYSTSSNAEIKVPLIYTWSSKLNGGGRIAGDDAVPAAYVFNSQAKAVIGDTKNFSVRMSFKDKAVAQVNTIPPSSSDGANHVPLHAEHLRDVVDPLTAVMVMSRGKGATPCSRRIPIFDGKQRFDLLMSSGGQQKVAETRPSGQPPIGYVCKVRYIPIAGHRNNDDTKTLANNGGIEVALRPIPSANLMVPYRITIPTRVGTATIVLQRMDISSPGQKQIALVH